MEPIEAKESRLRVVRDRAKRIDHGDSAAAMWRESLQADEPRGVVSSMIVALPEPWVVRTPISVVLEYYRGSVIAHWPEVEAWGEGPGASQALWDLKTSIAELAEGFFGQDALDIESLGERPRMWRSVLKSVLDTDAS